MTATPPRTITLPHGVVSVAEYGDPAGTPVLYCHGLPGSHVEAVAFDDAAAAVELRVIAIDRPGIGASSFAARRRVFEWADTVAVVADRFELDQFAVLGVSGGGPYALACACRLPDRVTDVVVVSSPAPRVREVKGGKWSSGLEVLRRFPFLARPIAARMAAAVRKPGGLAALIAKVAPADRSRLADDRELLAKIEANISTAFTQGGRGVAVDLQMLFARPWGFDLTDIAVPVTVWHGGVDGNVPVKDARRLADDLPICEVVVVEGAGHLLFVDHAAAILNSIRTR
ncbi:alpha/beta fold hydrolase [Nocardia wallacei]|uniref:Alpha/beta hydrolase n=1 Tax=Nocardia wallacei TaxID=480035 RepID=A0A7G1KDZ3_9NOCA|nr:alpha/beta hydrolase [Nocardia wallacei]BCK53210.1 alpha/beta hydrolase [Nocardia wallacei]